MHIPTTITPDISSYREEIAQYRKILRDVFLDSVYVTAKHRDNFPANFFEQLLAELKALASIPTSAEISIEVSCNQINESLIESLASYGYNRISLATTDKIDQTKLRSVVDVARSLFKAVNIDCVVKNFATNKDRELARIGDMATLNAQHLSIYGLPTHEAFLNVQDCLGKNGYQAYDPFHFSQNSHRCRYLMEVLQYNDYIGLGPGAHGCFTLNNRKHHCTTDSDYALWAQEVKNKLILTPLSQNDVMEEYLLQNLTLLDGIDFKRFQAFFDSKFDAIFNIEHALGYSHDDKPVLCRHSQAGLKATDNTHEGVARASYALLDSMY